MLDLAIKYDKRNTLLQALAWLAGGIVSFVVYLSMRGGSHESTAFIFMIMSGSGLFEFFRTLGKYGKVEKRYRPVATVRHEGQLTYDKVVKNGGRKLKKAENRFAIIKRPLLDKNDELDTGTDNDTHHEYTLHFDLGGGNRQSLKVKRNVYLDAVLGVEYYLVVTLDPLGNLSEVVSAYQWTNWTLSQDIIPYVEKTQIKEETNIPQETPANPVPVMEEAANGDRKSKRGPVIAIVLSVIALLLPLIGAVPLNIAALILSIVAIRKEKNGLTIASVVISAVAMAASLIVFLAAMNGIV